MKSEDLTIAAMNLSSAAPAAWRAFVDVIERCATQRMAECVRAPADGVFVAQGRARELAQLVETLRDCRKDFERIRAVKEKKL